MANQDVVKFGDTFYLKHESTGQYLVNNVGRQRYNFPQLGNTGKVKLELVGGTKGKDTPVTPGSHIKIRTTESVQNDILGAFTDSHNCYYWRDGYDNDKQSWSITKVSGEAGSIHYGDRVYLTNCSYTTQKLSADTRYQGYITTAENVQDLWILESPIATITRTEPRVFKWSVASGDPTETSVILWTRVDEEVYKKNPSSPLKYEIATDRDFTKTKIKIQGEVSGSTFGESTDYTVHIDVDKPPHQVDPAANNKLEPNKEYFYRFIYADETSPVGRCRTLPPANHEYTGESLKFAVLTCNDYSSGYFNALYTLAEEKKLDFIIHLGDFTYEYFKYPEGYGDIIRTDLFERRDAVTQKNKVATSLKDFRDIHRIYYEDPALQWAMANYTWIIMLDDHEFADNCYWDYEKQTLSINDEGAANPIYKGKNSEEMRQLYDGAIQAWTEYIPARVTQDVPYEVEVNGKKEQRRRYKLYRNFRFGKLLDFYLTDSRSFRDKPDLKKNAEIVEAAAEAKAKNPQTPASVCIADALADARKKASKDQNNPDNWRWSMLGPEQKQWLIDGLYPKTIPPNTTDTIWKVWGNQTLLALSPLCQSFTADDWHGFKAERYEILQTIKERESARPGIGNNKSHFVVFTGDMHTSMIAYLKPDYLASGVTDMLSAWFQTGKDELPTGDYSRYVGVEFMTPSLTSPGISEGIYAKLKVGVEKAGGTFEDWVIGKGTFKAVSEKLSPVTETASAAASYILGTVSSVLGTAISAVTPDALESIVNEASFHKLVTGNVVKSTSPHIEHFDSGINGYAIAEFTPDELKWRVYDVNTTDYDKLDDGQGSNVRNVSTNRVKRQLVQSATYQPNGINLLEHPLT